MKLRYRWAERVEEMGRELPNCGAMFLTTGICNANPLLPDYKIRTGKILVEQRSNITQQAYLSLFLKKQALQEWIVQGNRHIRLN